MRTIKKLKTLLEEKKPLEKIILKRP